MYLLFNVTFNDLSVINVTAHRCAGELKKLNRRSGYQLQRHYVGFFKTFPSKHRHGVTYSRAQKPKLLCPRKYCDHSLSGVRPSDNLHIQLLLQNRLIDFDETWHGWSSQCPLQVLLFFDQIRPGADPRRGQHRSWRVPFFKELLLQSGKLQEETKCIAMI